MCTGPEKWLQKGGSFFFGCQFKFQLQLSLLFRFLPHSHLISTARSALMQTRTWKDLPLFARHSFSTGLAAQAPKGKSCAQHCIGQKGRFFRPSTILFSMIRHCSYSSIFSLDSGCLSKIEPRRVASCGEQHGRKATSRTHSHTSLSNEKRRSRLHILGEVVHYGKGSRLLQALHTR